MKKTVVTAVLLASSVSAARAQRLRPVPAAGELIRVTPDSGAPFTGRLSAMGGDTLVLSPVVQGDTAVMVVASRHRVEVSRRHRERWSGLGALAGVSLGLIASQLQSGGAPEDGNTKRAEVAVVGGAAGAVIGGFLGFIVAPHRWQPLRATTRRAVPPTVLPPPAPADTSLPAPAIEPPTPTDTSAAPLPAPPASDTSAPPPTAPVAVPADSSVAPAPVSPPVRADSPPPATAPPAAPAPTSALPPPTPTAAPLAPRGG